MEVEYVVKEVEKVLLDFVQLILERSEVLVKSMKCVERKFVRCS